MLYEYISFEGNRYAHTQVHDIAIFPPAENGIAPHLSNMWLSSHLSRSFKQLYLVKLCSCIKAPHYIKPAMIASSDP